MVTVVSTEPHHSVVKETVCRNCGATLRYVPNDIQQKTVGDYTGDRDIVYYIICPNCGKQHSVRGY